MGIATKVTERDASGVSQYGFSSTETAAVSVGVAGRDGGEGAYVNFGGGA